MLTRAFCCLGSQLSSKGEQEELVERLKLSPSAPDNEHWTVRCLSGVKRGRGLKLFSSALVKQHHSLSVDRIYTSCLKTSCDVNSSHRLHLCFAKESVKVIVVYNLSGMTDLEIMAHSPQMLFEWTKHSGVELGE